MTLQKFSRMSLAARLVVIAIIRMLVGLLAPARQIACATFIEQCAVAPLAGSLAALLAVVMSLPVQSATFAWTDVSGSTSLGSNWSSGTSPNGIGVAGDTLNFNNAITANRTVTMNGLLRAGTLNIGDATSTNSFTLTSGAGGNLIMDASSGSAAISKALGANANDSISTGLQFDDTLAITNASTSGSLTFSGGMRSVSSDITFNGAGAITVSTAAVATGGNLIKNDAGTTTLSFANTYAGATTINGGTLKLITSAAALPARSAVTVASGATLDYSVTNTIIGSLAGAGDVVNTGASAILQIGRDDTSTTFTGRFVPTTPANMAITKIGVGTLTLAPTLASTYTGTTTISGGTLKLDFANTALTSLMAATPLTLTGGGNFTMVGKAGLAADQTLGGFTVGAGGAITLVAGDVAGTTLRMGAPTAGAAGGTLLLTAPTNTKVFINALYKDTTLNNRLVFSNGTANTFNWVQNNNSGANVVVAYVPVTALPVAGGGTNSTAYILTSSQTQTTANFIGQSLKLSSSSGSAQTLDLSTFNMTLGRNANTPGAILIDGTAAWNINGSTGVLNAASASDLIFHQYNTTNAVTVNAGIANGPALMSLTKAGPGTLVLAGTNTFTGSVFVNGGILKFSNVTAAGAGSLGNGSTTAVSISNGATLQYTGVTGTISGAAATAGAHTYSLVGGNGAISVSEAGTELTLNGAISGAGSLVKSGDGTLTLGAAATYTGSTIINTGTLKNSAADRLPTTPVFINTGAVWNMSAGDDTVGTIFGGGTIEAGGTARTLTVGGDNVSSMTTDGSNTFTTFTGIFSGAAAHNLTKVGNGTVTLANTVTSAWTGTTTISAGTLMIGAGTDAGDIATSSSIINNSALVYNVGSGSRTYGNAISGSGSLTQQSIGGSLTLTGTNTYTGATTIAAGTLQIGAGGIAGSLSTSSAITNNGALVFNRSDAIAQGADFSTAAITGAGSLTQAGTGKLSLNATNTYSGATIISSGTLAIDSAGSINNTSGISIGAGEFKYNSATPLSRTVSFSGTGGSLSGTGTITSALNVTAGNTLAPGNSPGALTVASGAFANGSIFSLDLTTNGTGTAGVDWDQLIVTGLLDLTGVSAGGINVSLVNSNGFGWDGATSHTWSSFITYGSVSGFNSNLFTINSSAFTGGTGTWSVVQGTDALNLQYVVVVPEPSTWALILGGLGMLGFARRLRRRSNA